MDTQFKLGDGRQVNFEKSAKVVKYKDGSLKDAMDEITTITEYGGKLLQAENLRELRHDLRVEVPQIYEESGYSYWKKVGEPTFTATHAKFGGKCAYVAPNNYITTAEPVTFGGNPFTIQFWMCVSSNSVNGQKAFTAGGITLTKTSATEMLYNTPSGNNVTLTGFLDKLCHYEFCYNGSKLYLFINGKAQRATTETIARSPRNLTLGGAIAWIDEFRILDGVCAHTANFTPPTAQYNVTDKTVALLHFD